MTSPPPTPTPIPTPMPPTPMTATTPPTATRPLRAVRVLARLQRMLEFTDAGLTIPQYRMLVVLSEGGERSARLAQRLAVRKPTLTALADGLIAAGYAERSSEPGDRRIVRLQLTGAGRAALARADEAYLAALAPLLDRMTDPDRLVDGLTDAGDALDAWLRARGPAPAQAAVPAPAQAAEPAPAQPVPAQTEPTPTEPIPTQAEPAAQAAQSAQSARAESAR
ncbi:MAG TPA: MarR family transcriptional regulator [Rugosimonospora sp.]